MLQEAKDHRDNRSSTIKLLGKSRPEAMGYADAELFKNREAHLGNAPPAPGRT